MPLYINNKTVDELLSEYMKLSHIETKPDTIRTVLESQIHDLKNKAPLIERLKPCLDLVKNIGTPGLKFNQKEFSDDLFDGM